MATKEEQEKQKQEAERRKRWLAIEEKRKTRESYEVKEISGWMYFGPFLGLLVAIIAGIMIWLSGESEAGGLWWIVGIGIAPLMLLGFTSDIDDSWKASVAAKEELENKKGKPDSDSEGEDYFSSSFGSAERTLNGFKYKYDYIYTDSVLSHYFYVLTKFVSGFSTVAFALLAAVLLFIWLGSISIAPTTIIIILLIIIILNQNRGKNV